MHLLHIRTAAIWLGILMMFLFIPAVIISGANLMASIELIVADPAQYERHSEQKLQAVTEMSFNEILSSPSNYSDWILHYLTGPLMVWLLSVWLVSAYRSIVEPHQWVLSFITDKN